MINKETTYIFNIGMHRMANPGVVTDYNELRDELVDNGFKVGGDKDENGDIIMVINGVTDPSVIFDLAADCGMEIEGCVTDENGEEVNLDELKDIEASIFDEDDNVEDDDTMKDEMDFIDSEAYAAFDDLGEDEVDDEDFTGIFEDEDFIDEDENIDFLDEDEDFVDECDCKGKKCKKEVVDEKDDIFAKWEDVLKECDELEEDEDFVDECDCKNKKCKKPARELFESRKRRISRLRRLNEGRYYGEDANDVVLVNNFIRSLSDIETEVAVDIIKDILNTGVTDLEDDILYILAEKLFIENAGGRNKAMLGAVYEENTDRIADAVYNEFGNIIEDVVDEYKVLEARKFNARRRLMENRRTNRNRKLILEKRKAAAKEELAERRKAKKLAEARRTRRTLSEAKRRRMLEEKKKGCCPGGNKKNNLVPFSEAVKEIDFEANKKKFKDALVPVKKIIDDLKSVTCGEFEAIDAFEKLKKENKALARIKKNKEMNYSLRDVPGAKKVIDSIKKLVPAEKAAEIDKFWDALPKAEASKAIVKGKKSLHESVILNGTRIGDMTSRELFDIFQEQKNEKMILTEMMSESKVNSPLYEKYKANADNKANVMSYIAEELKYRKLNSLLEDEETKAIENKEEKKEDAKEAELNNMFGVGDDTTSEEAEKKADTTEEDVEEVELAAVEIEMASEEDAKQLKEFCVDAGIPEDAMEVRVGGSDMEEDEDEEQSDDDKEEAEDENKEETSEDKKEESANESLSWKNIHRLLLEAEGEEPAAEDEEKKDEEPAGEEEKEEADEEVKEEDNRILFVLVDTDYIETLADVLDKEYGVSMEEFQEMIGGEFTTEDEEPATEDDDKEETEDEEKDDEISVADIFGDL